MENEDIVNLLKNYYTLKAETRLMELHNSAAPNKKRMEFLDACIDCLPPEDKQIVKKVFIEKQSASCIAREMYVSRSTLCRKKDKAVNTITALFSKHFENG